MHLAVFAINLAIKKPPTVGGLRQSGGTSGVQIRLAFGRNVVVILDFCLMARHLAIQFVSQFIHCGVEVSV